MNNSTTTWYNTTSASDNITLTASTGLNTTWFPYYEESEWLPYYNTKYKPEWHIVLGYKKQFKSMWADKNT